MKGKGRELVKYFNLSVMLRCSELIYCVIVRRQIAGQYWSSRDRPTHVRINAPIGRKKKRVAPSS